MSADDWAWAITGYVLVAGIATLFVWLHWADSPWYKAKRPEAEGSVYQMRYDTALQWHIRASVWAALWPLAALGLAWALLWRLLRWVRYGFGGEYPG